MTYDYDFINRYNSKFKPSAAHSSGTGSAWYFRRYLIQKILSVFEFKGIPDNWSKDYFLYTLFINGFVAVIETDKFGVIPQLCSLTGYDVFYRPTNAVISNPLLRGVLQPKIGVQCSLIKMQPDYGSCWDIVAYYADLLAMCTKTIASNLTNSQLAFVFACEDKTTAESFKKMFDKINSGDPAVFADKKLFAEDGTPLWTVFQNHLKNNYLVNELLSDMTKIDARFCTEVGIPNVNVAKESGVTANEVEANNIDTRSKAALWMETIRAGLDESNRMFGLDLSVDWRNYNDAFDNGNV